MRDDRRRYSVERGDFRRQRGVGRSSGATVSSRSSRAKRLLAEALALDVELVVGQAALVHARAGLVQLGLGALARGDLLGLLGARGAGRSVLAMGVGDLAAMTLELTRARLARRRGIAKAMSASPISTTTTMAMMTPVDMDLSSRFAIGATRPGSRETVDP